MLGTRRAAADDHALAYLTAAMTAHRRRHAVASLA
jgi:hypothetical protein